MGSHSTLIAGGDTEDMGNETELLWPGAALLLLLLGAVAGLCVRCSRPGKGDLRA